MKIFILTILLFMISEYPIIGVEYTEIQQSYDISKNTSMILEMTKTKNGIWTDNKNKIKFTPYVPEFTGIASVVFDKTNYIIKIKRK